jgi:hypothetical protein
MEKGSPKDFNENILQKRRSNLSEMLPFLLFPFTFYLFPFPLALIILELPILPTQILIRFFLGKEGFFAVPM